jgi:hypothetical protein
VDRQRIEARGMALVEGLDERGNHCGVAVDRQEGVGGADGRRGRGNPIEDQVGGRPEEDGVLAAGRFALHAVRDDQGVASSPQSASLS